MDFASPQGGANASPDKTRTSPSSSTSTSTSTSDPICAQFREDEAARSSLAHTMAIFEVSHVPYDAILILGGEGRGACEDLCRDMNAIELLEKFIAAEKVVGGVGQAVMIFIDLCAPEGGGGYFVAGRRVTCITTDAEEGEGHHRSEEALCLESRLRERGAVFENTRVGGEFAVRDGKFVTGQNRASAAETARLLLQAIEG